MKEQNRIKERQPQRRGEILRIRSERARYESRASMESPDIRSGAREFKA